MKTEADKKLQGCLVLGFIILSVIALIYAIFDKSESIKPSKTEWNDPGFYEPGIKGWPYYGKTNDDLIRELNSIFSNEPKTLENEKLLYDKIGGMIIDKSLTTSKRRHYDLLEVPISVDYINVNGVWRYGLFTKGGIKEGDTRLPK